ncbi:hypothetical protein SEPCBS119000_002938 [Sporothrix epigloea]|uniref:C6 zinc finger domain containing protein n=1 Tax=Sporothrix epigloea TaxID=1892477 RepID=A0ABP0DIU2_9PEZI
MVHRQRRRRAPIQYVQVPRTPTSESSGSSIAPVHSFMAVCPSSPQSPSSALQTTSESSESVTGQDATLASAAADHDETPSWVYQPPSSETLLNDQITSIPQLGIQYQQQLPLHSFSNEINSFNSDNGFNNLTGDYMSLLGHDAIATSDATNGFTVPPFDGTPVMGSEIVSRPSQQAFNYLASDSTVSWSMLQPQSASVELVHERTSLSLPLGGSFATNNSDEDDINLNSVVALDTYALQHNVSFSHPLYAGNASAQQMPPYASMMSPGTHNSLEFQMATRINNETISESLLQIYHDVLEHNFTCWITEETCPYNVWARPARHGPIYLLNNGGGAAPIAIGGRRTWSPHAEYQQQFGPTWNNRVYRRVIELDKMAQAAKMMHFTAAQNSQISKALHLVIMAFATQWAQNSDRQREAYAAGSATTNNTNRAEFDRKLQRTQWQEARQALQDCADIECYRIVCAELIFSITQRPWEESEFAELELATSRTQSGEDFSLPPGHEANSPKAKARRRRDAILSKLDEVISKDGPPVFVERAARKMHALKSKFDNYQLGFLGETTQGRSNRRDGQDAHGIPDFSAQHLASEASQTVGLLYWLAVMFDTISASMTERPVVLADDESQHEAAEHEVMFPDRGPASSTGPAGNTESISLQDIAQTMFSHGNINTNSSANFVDFSTPSYSGKKNNRWRIDLFIQDDPNRQSNAQAYHFPCPYDDAARIVTRCAPVKVLLYRQVLYMQSMLRKPYLHYGAPIEEVVQDTLMVYGYWNLTYGAFFRELIHHYAVVPTRIRGWFVCLLAHWHLGALLMADLLEKIDENRVGNDVSRASRTNAGTVERIRRSSALQLADLARVATPLMVNAESDPSMPDFHYAVREGTILTEPWTMLLIRAFTKASVLHLHMAEDIHDQGSAELLLEDEASRESLRLSEECIQAMWYLGKKSDMARNVAMVLSRAINA